MKHSFKRLLSMAMALVMVLSCVPVQVFAEECAHEYGVEIADASCTEPGSIVYTCGLCGDTYEEAGEEPAGHNYEVAEIPATCLEDGLITYTCTFCGESETESGEAALGHSYADGFCENCGEPDPEAEEPIEEPAKEPEQELTEVSAPDPVASDEGDGGDVDVGSMPEGMTRAELQSALNAASGSYTLTSNVTMDDGYALEVPEGMTLTVNGATIIMVTPIIKLNNGAKLILENGAKIDKQGDFLAPVTMNVSSGSYVMDNGVEFHDAFATYDVTSEESLRESIADAESAGYVAAEMFARSAEFEITKNLDLKYYLGINESTITIAEGVTVNLLNGNGDITTDGIFLGEGELINNGTLRLNNQAGISFGDNGVLTNNGTISMNNSEITIDSEATASIVNNGTIELLSGSSIVTRNRLEITGNGTITVDSEETLRCAIQAGCKVIRLKNANVTLSGDLTLPSAHDANIPQAQKLILDDATLTVPKGFTLTVNSRLNIQGGGVTVNGTLVNNVYEDGDDTTDDIGIWCEDGCLTVNGTYQNTKNGLIIVTTNNDFVIDGENPIPKSSINSNTYVRSEAELRDALDAASEYGHNQMCIYADITLSQNITIPENADIVVDGYESGELTIPAGMTLTNNGLIDIIGEGELVAEILVENGGTLINNSQINVEEVCSLTVAEGGTFTNNGEITGNGTYPDSSVEPPEGISLDELMNRVNDAIDRGEGELWLNEDAVLYGDLDMPDNFHIFTGFGITITVPAGKTLNLGGNGMSLNGSTLNVYGTLNVHSSLLVNNGSYVLVGQDAVLNQYGSIHVGFHKNENVEDYAGVMDIKGTMNVYGYTQISESTDYSGGVLNVYGTMNLKKSSDEDDDGNTYYNYGCLEVSGKFVLGGWATLDMTEITEPGNGGVTVNGSGSLVQEKQEDDTTTGTITMPNPGSVTIEAIADPRVDGIEKKMMIAGYNGGKDIDSLTKMLEAAGANVATYHDSHVNLWDTTIELDREVTIPKGVTLNLFNSGDGYYEEIIIPEGQKLINNGTIVLNEETALRIFGELENNGEIIVNQWASVTNYGTLKGNDVTLKGGDYAEGNTSQSALQEALDNLPENAGGWIHESVTELTENMTIDLGIRESDDVERTFKIAKYGQIIVPEGVTLTLNSPTMLNGGQIIVENGGELIVNNMLHIGSGTLYMEEGAYLDDQNGDIMGIVTWQDDEKPDHVSAYIVADNWDEDSNRYYFYNTIDEWEWGASHDQQVLPGYGRALIFYLNHWNAEETIWERTPIHPDELTADDGLTIMHLMDDFNPDEFGIRGDQKYGDCFVMLRTDADESLWDTTRYVRYGTHSFPVYIQRDQDMGFYSAMEASNETFLDSFGFAPGADNSFYFIVTDPNLTALKLYAELQAGPNEVQDGVYCEKVGYNTWKMQLDDSVTKYMDRNYWLQVRVQVKDTEGNQWYTTRGLNCAPWIWMRGMHDAMLEFNNEEYRYYAEADQWLVNRQMENGGWSEFDTELPQGVSYDLDSNTLTLNGVNLETLGIGYHWVNEHEDTEGYNLPNSDLIIEVHGDNNIGGGRNAFWLRGGVNATIAGDGSLNIENDNSEQLVWNANAVDVEDSTLTIGGSVEITMEVSGQNWWDFEGNDGIGETPCTMHAIQGDGTSNLIITDSAKVTVRVPDLREQEIDGEVFGYRGLANFANVTVEKQAVLNLDTLHLYEGQKFIQNGGTITVTDPGTIAENGTKFYEPVVVRDGSRVQINGGTMNLTLDDTSENARGTIIKVENNSTLRISGGQLVIRNNVKAPGIYVDNASWLYVTGGTMLYYDDLYALCGERTPVINVDGYADFTGGTIRVENGEFYFNSWNEAAPMIQWRGTNLIAKNTIIEQNGTFKMSGGKLQLTNSRIHANNETAFSGGTVTMNDSVLIAKGATAVDGVAQLNFNVTDAYYTDTFYEETGTAFPDNCVIEVNNYFPVAGFANITIDAVFTDYGKDFSGIRNSGTFHQMGGTVTVNSNGNASAFDSFGDMLLNFGTMSLSGGVALRVEEGGMVQTMDGMTLNVTGREQAVQLCGTADIAGGSLNVTADNGENKGGGHGIYVGENALLDFTGGIHSFHTGSIGIHADKGTVNIAAEPMITMESGVALFSVGTEEDNNVRFHFAEGSTLLDTDANAAPTKWLTDAENQYVKMLSADGEVPTTNLQINIGTVKTLLELLPELETVTDEHGNVRHLLKQTAIVDKSMVLEDTILDVMEGGMLIIRNGAELTIPDGSSHLIAMDGGRILVENGRIDNGGIMAADGGSIIVNNDGYEALESGVLNVHFHEVQVLDDGGNYVDEIYVSEVRGIPLEEQILDGTVDTTNGLTTVLNNYTGLGYSQVRIWTGNDMDLSGQYIPADTSLSIDGYETAAKVTVGTGTELCIDGELNLGNVEFTVNGGLTNYGYIGTDIHDNAKIIVNGSFGNHGQILLNRATMDVNGTFKLWNHDANLEVNDGSVIHVHTNGELINNGTLWVGYWKQSEEEAKENGCEYIEGAAGTVNVDGKLEVWLQMNVDGGSVVNVNDGGSLTVSLDHEADIYGGMNLSGEMNVKSGGNFYVENYLEIYGTVNAAGAFHICEDSDGVELFGTVNVAEGGTLTNDYEIWMRDTEDSTGAKLILNGGTFNNNGSLYNASYGGTVDVTNGTFSNRKANADDPDDYDAEVLTRYFEDGSIAAMNGIDKGMIVLTYEGASTITADAMARYAEAKGYGNSLFRVDGAATVAQGQTVTVNTIVMLTGSQLGVNGTLNSNYLLWMRSDARMAISSVGHVYINGALRVDPADDDNNLSAAVLNNWGILECGSQGVLDIWGEYNVFGEGVVYNHMEPMPNNDGYHLGGISEETEIYEDDVILIMDATEHWHVNDLLAWVMEYGYRGGIIRIDTAVEINHDLYIPENVTVEISDSGSLHMDGVLNNNSTIVVDGNDCALTAADAGSYTGAGTYSGYCGNDEAPKTLTWTVKNNVLTISGKGVMGNYSEETPAPWKYFSGNISRIVLGDDVTNIGSGAFSGFDATMTIPETVKTFGEQPFGNCTLKIYHKSDAETFVKGENSGVAEEQILFFHVIDPETGICTGCDYSLNAILNNDSTTAVEKTEELKSFDSDSLKSEMEKSEELVEQLDQLEQELGSVTSVEVGIKHSEDVSPEIADAFSNVHEDAAIVGAVLNAEEGVEEVNLVIGDPENTLDETQTEGYNMDASVHFSMTMEGVGDASQLDIPVKITLPVPDSIYDLSKLIVKHFHAGGEEDLSKSCVVTVDEDGKAYVSFIITGFSDFLLAQERTDVTVTAKVTPGTVTTETPLENIDISMVVRNNNGKIVKDLDTSFIIVKKVDNEEVEVELEDALAEPGEYTVIPTWEYKPEYRVNSINATLIVKEMEYSCVISDEKFESVTDALAAAETGDVVRLIQDVNENVEVLIVSAGTTLDLNGHYIKASNVLGFGTIMDSKGDATPDEVLEGDVPSEMADDTETGGIINGRSNAEFVKLSEENTGYIPIYDSQTHSYKFYEGSVMSLGGKSSGQTAVKFGIRIWMNNPEGYLVLSRTSDSNLRLSLDMTWTGTEGFEMVYPMRNATVKAYGDAAYKQIMSENKMTKAMTLTVSGLDKLGENAVITCKPTLCADSQFVDEADKMSYTVPSN